MSARRNTRRTKLTTQVAGCFYFQIRTRCERLATQLLRWKYFYFCRELRRRNPSHHADPSWIERSRNKPERILSLERYLKPSDSRRLIVASVPSRFFFFFLFSFLLLLFPPPATELAPLIRNMKKSRSSQRFITRARPISFGNLVVYLTWKNWNDLEPRNRIEIEWNI